MRSIRLLLTAVCVVALAPGAMGGPRPASHTEDQAYLVPTGVTTSHEDSLPSGPTKDLGPRLEFHPVAGDRYISFAVADMTARSVILEIEQQDPEGGAPLKGYMCQSVMPAAYRLVSLEVVSVRVLHGLCGNHNWGWATQGTVTATFSRENPGQVQHLSGHHHH